MGEGRNRVDVVTKQLPTVMQNKIFAYKIRVCRKPHVKTGNLNANPFNYNPESFIVESCAEWEIFQMKQN